MAHNNLPFTVEEHTADIKITTQGTTQKELFLNAAESLWYFLEPVYSDQPLSRELPITLHADNITYLLVDFLSELITYADTYNTAYTVINLNELTQFRCVGTIAGFPVERFSGIEIKGVTYHQADVTFKDGQWHAQIIYDI